MLLGFLGVEDVKFIYAEGISISAEQKEKSLPAARSELKAA
jgi:FMN-dependent NADH-azoreductase